MKSLEEVIKYKLNFLPKKTDPFYILQKYVEEGRKCSYYLYQSENTIFSNDSFSLMEDITPFFIYISSCDKYYRENGYGEIEDISIHLFIPGFNTLRFGRSVTYDNENNDLGEHRIAIFKNRLNKDFSRAGYCTCYIEPFKIEIDARFTLFPTLINDYKTFKLEECIICLEKEPKVLFCNCGHLCICKKCLVSRFDNCPVCKKENMILRIIE